MRCSTVASYGELDVRALAHLVFALTFGFFVMLSLKSIDKWLRRNDAPTPRVRRRARPGQRLTTQADRLGASKTNDPLAPAKPKPPFPTVHW